MSIMDSNNKKSRQNPQDDDFANNRIRVGKDYQVPVLAFTGPPPKQESQPDKALLVWSPSHRIPDKDLSKYLRAARDKFGYNEEQALGMLFWHRHNLKEAIKDIANFTPRPDDWSVDDKILFEQAFQFHGKNFYGIRSMLPEKKISHLVKYYYTWKKIKHHVSLIDKYEKKRASGNSSENGKIDIDEDMSDSDNLEDKKKWKPGCQQKAPVPVTRRSESQGEGFCSNCNIHCSNCVPSPKGKMCGSCFMHFQRTGSLRPTMAKDVNTLSVLKLRKEPPKGMYVNHDALCKISVDAQANLILSNLSNEIVSCKRVCQFNKQTINSLREKISSHEPIAKYYPTPSAKTPVIDSSWTSEEMSLAVRGIHKYGKDFKAIAEVIGTKSESHIRHFYNKYKNCYNLDTLLAENDPGNCIKDEGSK